MKVQLQKGDSAISFEIANDKVASVLVGNDVDPVAHEVLLVNMRQELKALLPDDISTKKIAVLIPDDTRLWARGDIFVPEIIKLLCDARVPAENISIIIALGTHADMAEEKFPLLAGDVDVTILNSANKNSDRLVFLGETSRKTPLYFTKEAYLAEHIIIFGGVLHHMLAGYGGGRKYVFPGIAGYDSVQKNHSLAMTADGAAHPSVIQTCLQGNPVHEDMQEATEIFLQQKRCTYVAVTANGTGEIFHTEVGALETAFSKSCAQLDNACCHEIDEKKDFALISAGGHRTDGQLYQATKALFNGVSAVREGGHILFVADCRDGSGNPVFEEALLKFHKNQGELGQRLSDSFDMPSYVAYRVIDLLMRFQITLVSSFSQQQTEELGFKYTNNLENYVNNLTGKGYIIPFAENILPKVRQTEENTQ